MIILVFVAVSLSLSIFIISCAFSYKIVKSIPSEIESDSDDDDEKRLVVETALEERLKAFQAARFGGLEEPGQIIARRAIAERLKQRDQTNG